MAEAIAADTEGIAEAIAADTEGIAAAEDIEAIPEDMEEATGKEEVSTGAQSQGRCTVLYAQTAESSAKCHSCLRLESQSGARNATGRQKDSDHDSSYFYFIFLMR